MSDSSFENRNSKAASVRLFFWCQMPMFIPLAETDELQKLSFNCPILAWDGVIPNVDSIDVFRSHISSVFVIDVDMLGPSEESDRFIETLLGQALDHQIHKFIVSGAPKRLHAIFRRFFERLDHDKTYLRARDILGADASIAECYRHLTRHFLVGSMVDSDTCATLEHSLPWLCDIRHVPTFIWITGRLDQDIDLSDLRPWNGDTPDHADFDLFEGIAYEVGSYGYRDSANAFRRRFRSLTVAIFSLPDHLSPDQALHVSNQADAAARAGVPNILVADTTYKALASVDDHCRFAPREFLIALKSEAW